MIFRKEKQWDSFVFFIYEMWCFIQFVTSSIKYDTQDIKLWSMADINYAQSQIGHGVL